MKKAKDYSKQYIDAENKEKALLDIIKEIMGEAEQIKEMRNVSTDAGFVAILKELNEKWNAFARRVDGIKQDGFIEFMKNRIPVLIEYNV